MCMGWGGGGETNQLGGEGSGWAGKWVRPG